MRGFSDQVAPVQKTFEAYGVQIRVRVSTEELMARAEPLFPPGYREIDPETEANLIGIVEEEDGSYSVYAGYEGANRALESGSLELALVTFDDQLQSMVALGAVNLVFVHAGVVAQNGEAIVIPGNSFSGKSTLVQALVRRGAVYFSDEFAVIDTDGMVHPYARPLNLRQFQREGEPWSGNRSVDSLGGVAGEERLPLGMAIVTHYVPGAEWSPRRLSRGEGALALLSHAIPARYRPSESLQMLSRAVDGATVLEGERGEAAEFAQMLLEGAPA